MGNDENSAYVYEDKNKESEVVDLEDYFQIKFVNGEPVFVCNIWN